MSEILTLEGLTKAFEAYGLYFLFTALLLENLIMLGLVVPGESVLLVGSVVAARSETIDPVSVALVGMTAAMIGQVSGYFIGKYGGEALVKRLGKRFRVSEERIDSAEKYFEAHGGKTVIIGRFATGIRVFIPLIAGFSRMNFPKFVLFTFIAVTSWTTVIVTLGYFFGQNWELIVSGIKTFGGTVALLAAVAVFVVLMRRRKANQ